MPKIVKDLIEKDKIRGKMKLVFQEMKQKSILKQEIVTELLIAKTSDHAVTFDPRVRDEIEKIKIVKNMHKSLDKIKLRRKTPLRWRHR